MQKVTCGGSGLIVFLLLWAVSGNAGPPGHEASVFRWNGGFGTFEPVITDSVVWRTVSVDSLHLGDEKCKHSWTYSKTWRAGGAIVCGVLHGGFHCSWDDLMRDRICGKCFRKETQREFWYQREKEHVKTEYEILEERLEKR